MLRYLSLFSGIEAASCAWAELPMQLVGLSEIEPFCCNVLAKHFSDTPNLGDITKFTTGTLDKYQGIDLIVGGSPCQGLSVAGKRLGLEDERSRLALNYIAVIGYLHPRWIVWENVQGVLSTHKGADFRVLISLLEKLGYSLCWRVLNAQYFGVPQIRRRIYLVGYLGPSSERPAQVLFEPESLSGSATQNEGAQRDDTRVTAGSVISPSSVLDMSHACDVLRYYKDKVPTLTARMGTGGNQIPMVFSWIKSNYSTWKESKVTVPCTAHDAKEPLTLIATPRLRKLTPKECLRLQGFPDTWFDGVPKYSDTAAYKAVGNSMAVPVMRWIGERICRVDANES